MPYAFSSLSHFFYPCISNHHERLHHNLRTISISACGLTQIFGANCDFLH
ncbi:conserved hypothetical protein [Ricinus communis]|uniref:Uncharacterized protein n=1 Tax=Ricinus communis TaxID=3988 RepID=B9S9U4_RICCO|nr:conserved hypothetical protein [Ricinus communis]